MYPGERAIPGRGMRKNDATDAFGEDRAWVGLTGRWRW
jgi:hypothetical protein